MDSTYKMLIRVLKGQFGFVVFDEYQDDFSISDYILDSIAFIKFIIIIEEEIAAELPDDFLEFDILNSAKGFAEKLGFFIDSVKKENCVK